MNPRLLIRLTATGDLHWLGLPEGASGTGAVPEMLRAPQREVVVLVPAEDVLLTTAELPRANPAKLARVLPFALEDQVLDPVEHLHFALGPRVDDGRHAVAVVARERLQAWLTRLHDAGIVADALLPDTLALPFAASTATILQEPERLLLRNGACSGFACAWGELDAWLTADNALHGVRWYEAAASAASANLTSLLPGGIDIDKQPTAPVMTIFAQGLGGGKPALDLLQGEWAPRHRHAPQRRLWRIAAMLALAAIGLGLVAQVADLMQLRAANAQMESAIGKLYADAFPQAPPTPDPVARMRSELQRLGAGTTETGLLSMLGKIAPILSSHDSQMVTLGMEYRAGTLELAVRAINVAGLDRLRERLETIPGMRVEVTAATPGEAGVEGRLRIVRGGA